MFAIQNAVFPPLPFLNQIRIILNNEIKAALNASSSSFNASEMTTKRKSSSIRAESTKSSGCENKRKSFPSSFLPFSVMTYNCLSQTALEFHPYLYRSVPKERLEWDYRWERLKEELVRSRSDIICLQEVQGDHYEECYLPYMNNQVRLSCLRSSLSPSSRILCLLNEYDIEIKTVILNCRVMTLLTRQERVIKTMDAPSFTTLPDSNASKRKS